MLRCSECYIPADLWRVTSWHSA